MKTVVMSNLKGGVGKTSSCHHLSGTLSRQGLRILLVDVDPQASLTTGFWGPDATRSVSPGESVAALFDPDLAPIPEALIRPTGIDGISIVPGSHHLTHYNMVPRDRWSESEMGIREFLGELESSYDLAILDAPPNLHLCTRAALVAADFLVTPLQPEDYGSQGIAPVLDALADVQSGPNPGIRLAGFLVTMFDKRLGIHAAYEGMLRDVYGPDVFTAHFPLMAPYKEAVASRLPISHYKPKSAAAKAVGVIADELLMRIGFEAPATGARRVA